MKKITFIGSAALGVISIFMYLCLDVVEQLSKNYLIAYMTASEVSFSNDMFLFNFTNLKIVVITLAIVFFVLAVASLLWHEKK